MARGAGAPWRWGFPCPPLHTPLPCLPQFNNMLLYCVPRVIQVGAHFQVRTRIDVAGMKVRGAPATVKRHPEGGPKYRGEQEGPTGFSARAQAKEDVGNLGLELPVLAPSPPARALPVPTGLWGARPRLVSLGFPHCLHQCFQNSHVCMSPWGGGKGLVKIQVLTQCVGRGAFLASSQGDADTADPQATLSRKGPDCHVPIQRWPPAMVTGTSPASSHQVLTIAL